MSSLDAAAMVGCEIPVGGKGCGSTRAARATCRQALLGLEMARRGLPAGAVGRRCGGGSPAAVRRGRGGVGRTGSFWGPMRTNLVA
jgi:hypothetical protein